MNKADLISAVAAESGLSKADAKKAVEGVVSAVSNALKSGDKVSLVGFGTFSVVEKAERNGYQPGDQRIYHQLKQKSNQIQGRC